MEHCLDNLDEMQEHLGLPDQVSVPEDLEEEEEEEEDPDQEDLEEEEEEEEELILQHLLLESLWKLQHEHLSMASLLWIH